MDTQRYTTDMEKGRILGMHQSGISLRDIAVSVGKSIFGSILVTISFFLFTSFFIILVYETQKKAEVFHVSLNQEGNIPLNWIVDYNKESVWFDVQIPAGFKWFALGFSDRGKPFPADYCVLWYDWKGHMHFQDSWADSAGVLHLEDSQDCQGIESKLQNDVFRFMFHRKFDTCDNNDYIIQDGTTHIVWATGTDVLYRLQGLNITTTDENWGMVRVQLLKNTDYNTDEPVGAQKLDILNDRVNVPDEETTYWCHVFKLPDKFKRKHHIVQYVPKIEKVNEGVVHHLEVFHCVTSADVEIPLYAGSCFAKDRPELTQVCKRVIAAWAMGANGFTYPEEAALPIGGPGFNPYLMLEIHYNNPEKRKGIVDSSGVRLYVTSKLRAMDASIIELGLEYTDKMAIPPKQHAFQLHSYCVTECTAVSLPASGIIIFGSQLHTHLTGTRVVTRHFRNGIELPELNRDDHYSTHFQEIRRLKRFVRVLPGDALITTCTYRTEDRKNVTLGGFAISDEMCVNYIHYYPATSLEVCKSAISDEGLSAYFQYMHEWENQDTPRTKPISQKYNSIEWNKMRVEQLAEVYNEAPLGMQCNMSSGDRFPGYWENTPITPILKPLPPPVRKCFNTK